MTARIKKKVLTAAAVVAASTAIFVGNVGTSAAAAPSLPAYGLIGDGSLMCAFDTSKPGVLNWVRVVDGLEGGETRLIGIDIRAQDNILYGVGDLGNVYQIQIVNEEVKASKVSQLTEVLWGTSFDIDFNPAADRLRVISDRGQNLRHDLGANLTTEDSPLSTPPISGVTKGVTAAAYTNNDVNAQSATTLFTIGTLTDQVLIQSPANIGTQAATGALTNVDATINAGFDIYSDLVNNKAVSVTGFAALVAPNGVASLYTVNLLNGEVTSAGRFPLAVNDVAVMLDADPVS